MNMKNANDFIRENPHIKLDQFVDEEIPVQKNSFNPKTGKVFSTYKLEKVKTKYVNAPKEKVSCRDNDHTYRVADTHKWIFACLNCPVAKKALPFTHKFIKGKLIRKATGRFV